MGGLDFSVVGDKAILAGAALLRQVDRLKTGSKCGMDRKLLTQIGGAEFLPTLPAGTPATARVN